MKIISQDLTKFSTIRTKSLAEYYCKPRSIPELKEAIKFKNSKNLSIVILGNGSNILFSKDYYDNILFIKLSGDFNFFNINKNNIEIGAGYSMKIAGKQLIKLGYQDFIFFNLIPATIGGAITQNAGTGASEEIKDLCIEIKVLDVDNNMELTFSNEECLFTYRNSIIKKSKGKYIVLSATFSIENMTADIDSLILKTKDRINEKANREPIGYSFGSTFKNNSLPAWECVKKVSDSHKKNWRYQWDINEAQKMVLRTHTTCVTIKYLA